MHRPRCSAQETPHPKSALIDLRWEATYWLTLSVQELQAKVAEERKRGVSGHWTYDLNRHRAMIAALKVVKARQKA